MISNMKTPVIQGNASFALLCMLMGFKKSFRVVLWILEDFVVRSKTRKEFYFNFHFSHFSFHCSHICLRTCTV